MRSFQPKAQETESRVVVSTRRRRASSAPTTLQLNGVNVHFPFQPYPCQEAYMRKVMESLFRAENALLESPTGTGKTLCLLCATLAWQREQARLVHLAAQDVPREDMQQQPQMSQQQKQPQRRVPTVIYASRTHSQLTQVLRELKTTRYRPQHAILGSREQMCVNPKVKTQHASSFDINHDCNKLGKDRKCRFKNNLERFSLPVDDSASGGGTQPIMDIEELLEVGKKHNVCPFYYTRSLVEGAELILMPYNYLFDKDSRTTTLAEIAWENAVVIFDEAHNLESFASDSASFDLSNGDIAGCIAELTKAMNYVQALPDLQLKVDNIVRLKALFLSLEEYLVNLGPQTAYSGEFMMHFFQQGAKITHANHDLFIQEIKKINDAIMDMRGTGATRGSPKLEHFIQCLKRVYGHPLESRCVAKAAYYRVHVSPKTTDPNAGRTISYWCFAPAMAMEELAGLKVRSILVTSGTLSPLPSYAMELGLPFPNVLENPHIIGDDQIHVRVIGTGVTGKILNSSYQRRQDGEYYSELGNTLVNIARVTPDGMLVFFPSYGVMETCLERWGGPSSSRSYSDQDKKKNFFAIRKKQSAANQYSFPMIPAAFASNTPSNTPWKRMLSCKSIVLEPRSSADLPDAMSEFKRLLDLPQSKGCILMGVCRGKISEGIDFANEMSRAVVITGIPFAPSHDAKVQLKREFLDLARANKSVKPRTDSGFGDPGNNIARDASLTLSGNDWYTQQAHRAVNQAIGRVIRNRNDYGAVLLLDSRFGDKRNQIGLSKWVRAHVQPDEGYGVANKGLIQFFKTAEARAKERAEEEAKSTGRVSLAYDDEKPLPPIAKTVEDEITKVALIRNGEVPESTAASGSANGGSSYVPPERVIARIDMKDIDKPKEHTISDAKGDTLTISTKGGSFIDSVFESSKRLKPTGGTSESKSIAASFMHKLTNQFPPSEQSKIKKLIKAMKQCGENKDEKGYMIHVRGVISIICQVEAFDKAIQAKEKPMVFLFCELQPSQHRSAIQSIAMNCVYEHSSLGKLCRDALSDLDAGRIQTGISTLLVSLWCDGPVSATPSKEYLREVQFNLKIVLKAEGKASSMINALLKIIPESYHSSTSAIADDILASRNIQKLRETDKTNRGEAVVDGAAFQRSSLARFSSLSKPEIVVAGSSDTVKSPTDTSTNMQPAAGSSIAPQKSVVPPKAKPTINSYITRKRPAETENLAPGKPASIKPAAVGLNSTRKRPAESENPVPAKPPLNKPTTNPYATKSKPSSKPVVMSQQNAPVSSTTQPNRAFSQVASMKKADPVQACLQQVGSEVYVQRKNAAIWHACLVGWNGYNVRPVVLLVESPA
ncbi:regulator of telomere elongation helicase 1 [Fistulifera solaris]|uniref:Regulator of telomere elongation helicase 1 n=1 Tax=Fistulifera solaris TaxID=1519565 RepID=A0A1Z5KJ18_FISSO|nr:regulator of telomere elongation helicase 1 [Fistulifera solaris]|eukprot:GAX25948.1 regulator of telomere elongation helicase 1 [Fistulifera solaris]